MTKISEIPQGLYEKVQEMFESDPRIQRMRVKMGTLQRNGRFMEALAEGKKIEEAFNNVLHAFLAECEKEAQSIPVDSLPLSDEDKDMMLVYCLTVFICCDMIDSAIMDVDNLLYKVDSTLKFEMFNDIKDLKTLVRGKLEFLKKNSKYMEDLVWSEKCDDIYGMTVNKAKSLLRRQKQLTERKK